MFHVEQFAFAEKTGLVGQRPTPSPSTYKGGKLKLIKKQTKKGG
jgi:hypothetical protein